MPERKAGNNSTESQKQEKVKAAPIANIEGLAIPTDYANNIASLLTLWDVRLEFGLVQSATDGVLEVQPLARVMLSPQHMKAAASLLDRLVKVYERRHGPIILPPGAIPTYNDEEDGD